MQQKHTPLQSMYLPTFILYDHIDQAQAQAPPCDSLPHVHEFKKTHGTHITAHPLSLPDNGRRSPLPPCSVSRLTFLTEKMFSAPSLLWQEIEGKLPYSTCSDGKTPKSTFFTLLDKKFHVTPYIYAQKDNYTAARLIGPLFWPPRIVRIGGLFMIGPLTGLL